MNKEIEEKIVRSFIIKNRKDRALYALYSKKRRSFIWDFYGGLFKENCKVRISTPIPSYKTVLQILEERKAPDQCYVMSIDEAIDGREMPLEEALKEVVGFGPALISCDHGKLAYLECEQSFGAPERYLLISK